MLVQRDIKSISRIQRARPDILTASVTQVNVFIWYKVHYDIMTVDLKGFMWHT